MPVTQLGVRAHDYGRHTPEELFRRIRDDGLDAVQLALPKAIEGIDTLGAVSDAMLTRIQNALAAYRIHVAVLGVYIDPVNVGDPVGREKGVRAFVDSIPVAKALGADCVGTETSLFPGAPGVTRKQALAMLCRSLETILTQAEACRQTVGIEPVWLHSMNTPELAVEVLRTMASPWLKIIFDPVNLLFPGRMAEQDELWARAFDAFGAQISVVHLKGAVPDETGQIVPSDFAHSAVHYDVLMDGLRRLPQDFCLLREEIDPAHAQEDHRFLDGLLAAR